MNAIDVHAGMADERRARLARAGQQADRRRRNPAGAQGLGETQRDPRRLLGRLEHNGVTGGERRRRHPARDRQREVPRRDDRDDAARHVAQLVALAGNLEQRPSAVELDRRPRVVLEEVDRLADVGVGLAPRLGAFAHLQRGELEPPLAQPAGGGDQRRGAPGGADRAPGLGAGAARRRRHGGIDVAGGRRRGLGDDPLWPSRIGRYESVAGPRVLADPHRHAQRELGVDRRQRVGEPAAHRGAPQLEDRLVGERRRAHGAASSCSSATPRACSARKDSLLVFSSSRRTR